MEPKAKEIYYTQDWTIKSNGCDLIELFLWKDAIDDLFRDFNKKHYGSLARGSSGIIHLTLPEKIQKTPAEDDFKFRACLFGGIGNINYANQIKQAKELGINILISDVTHQEIKSFISPSDYEFISNKLAFTSLVPPLIHLDKWFLTYLKAKMKLFFRVYLSFAKQVPT